MRYLVILCAWLVLPALTWAATPPTLSDYQQSNWTDTGAVNEVTPTVTWSAGDVIVVLGATEDNSGGLLNTPTATGLTFSALAGTPTNTGSRTKIYAWSATAGAGGSGAITATRGDAGAARGISAFVYTGSDGIGTIAVQASNGSATTHSLARGFDNSAVVQVMGDWSATSDVTVSWTPSGFTERVAVLAASAATFFVANWTDQGAAGTTSYGFTAGAGTTYSVVTVEVKGAASGGGADTFGFRKRIPQ